MKTFEVVLQVTKSVLMEAETAYEAEHCGYVRWQQEIALGRCPPDGGESNVTATKIQEVDIKGRDVLKR